MTQYSEGGGAITGQGKRVSPAQYALHSLRDAVEMRRLTSSSLRRWRGPGFDDARGAVKPQGMGGGYVAPPAEVEAEGRDTPAPLTGTHDSDNSDDDHRVQPVKDRTPTTYRKTIERKKVEKSEGRKGTKVNVGPQEGRKGLGK